MDRIIIILMIPNNHIIIIIMLNINNIHNIIHNNKIYNNKFNKDHKVVLGIMEKCHWMVLVHRSLIYKNMLNQQ